MKEKLNKLFHNYCKDLNNPDKLIFNDFRKNGFLDELVVYIETKEKEAFEAGINYFEEFDKSYNYSEESREEGKRELFKEYKQTQE